MYLLVPTQLPGASLQEMNGSSWISWEDIIMRLYNSLKMSSDFANVQKCQSFLAVPRCQTCQHSSSGFVSITQMSPSALELQEGSFAGFRTRCGLAVLGLLLALVCCCFLCLVVIFISQKVCLKRGHQLFQIVWTALAGHFVRQN